MQSIKYIAKEWDYSFKSMNWWNREKVKNAKVMVVGCGALGNEVIKNIVFMNIAHIVIVDFDEIEYSNLSRSILFDQTNAKNAKRKVDAVKEKITHINDSVHIEAIYADIRFGVGLSLFNDVDVIISCVDNRLARLFINKYAFMFSTPWIDGAIENISGKVKVYQKGESCYECNLSETERQDIQAKLSCADVEAEVHLHGSIPTTSIAASIIGAIQVQEALKIIHGYQDKLMSTSLYYEGLHNLYLNYDENNKNMDCHCNCKDITVQTSGLSNQALLIDLFSEIDTTYEHSNPIILLRNPFVTKVQLVEVNKTVNVSLPKYRLKNHFEETVVLLDHTDKIDRQFAHRHYSLEQLGINDCDIIKYIGDDGRIKFLNLNPKS